MVISFINVSSGRGEKKKPSTFRKEDNGSEWAQKAKSEVSTGTRDQPPCPTPLHLDYPSGRMWERQAAVVEGSMQGSLQGKLGTKLEKAVWKSLLWNN